MYLNNNRIRLEHYNKTQEEVIDYNEQPYIATYYFNPKPFDDEDVVIPFYITDYYQKEYVSELYSDTFTVRYEINGKENFVNNLRAGDNKINFGTLPLGENWFSIQVIDKYGRKSHVIYAEILVLNRDDYTITKEQTYIITNNDLIRFKINKNDSQIEEDMINVRLGFSDLLKEIRDSGYRKCVIPIGKYRFNQCTRMGTGLDKPIIIPSGLTIDLNGSTFKQHPFSGHESCFFRFDKCVDSHLINGNLEGDYEERKINGWLSNYNGEGAGSIQMQGGKYNSVENLTIDSITGYSLMTSFGRCVFGSFRSSTWLADTSIENGDIKTELGKSTSDFIDLTKIRTATFNNQYVIIAKYLGYQGLTGLSWIFKAHFYDENENFLETVVSHQYRKIRIPEKAKYLRVTMVGNVTSQDGISAYNMEVPSYCLYKNLTNINTRTCAIAFCQMNHILVEDCTFKKCGQSITPCAIDLEDGWQQMQDFYMRRCNILERSGTACYIANAGFNHVLEQCDNWRFIIRRPQGTVVRNCTNSNLRIDGSNYLRSGYSRYHNNTLLGCSISYDSNTSLPVVMTVIKDCITHGPVSCDERSGTYYRCSIGELLNGTFNGCLGDASYRDCKFTVGADFLGYIFKAKLINCEFTPTKEFTGRYRISFNGGHLNSYTFENCKFNGKSTLANHTNFYTGKFIKCEFEDVTIKPSVLANDGDKIYFYDCKINYSVDNFIHYSPFGYSKGTFTDIEFNKCSITNIDNNTKSFINAYSKPNGALTFNDCNINIPKEIIIFDGYPTNLNFIEDYTMTFNNSVIDDSYKLLSTYFSNSKNIKIVINKVPI